MRAVLLSSCTESAFSCTQLALSMRIWPVCQSLHTYLQLAVSSLFSYMSRGSHQLFVCESLCGHKPSSRGDTHTQPGDIQTQRLTLRRSTCADASVMSAGAESSAAQQLRGDVVAEMQRQKDTLQWFVDEPWDAYIRRMSLPGTWGGTNPAVHAVAAMSDRCTLQAACPFPALAGVQI
jgi:hypothetical protein